MGQQTTSTTTTVPKAGGQESSLMATLQKLLQGQAGQLGDISQIAAGNFQPTEEDKRLIAESMGFTRDIASRDITALSAEGQARLDEVLGARGIQGSSFESVDRAILERDLQRQGANMLDQSRQEGNQALMQLPFQRAGIQLSANQQLFQNILGAANPMLSSLLQSRLSNTTTTQKAPGFGFSDALSLGKVAAAPFTGGASLAIPTGGSPSMGSSAVPPSLIGGFQAGLNQRNK